MEDYVEIPQTLEAELSRYPAIALLGLPTSQQLRNGTILDVYQYVNG